MREERIDWFLTDEILLSAGSECGFGILFSNYKDWRRRYGILRTRFSEEQFARIVQALGIHADFGRRLLLDIRIAPESPSVLVEESSG
jgi:hypothetical protein